LISGKKPAGWPVFVFSAFAKNVKTLRRQSLSKIEKPAGRSKNAENKNIPAGRYVFRARRRRRSNPPAAMPIDPLKPFL